MVIPSKEVLELWEIIDNGTKEEAAIARRKLTEILLKEEEEKKKNPPIWGNDIMF